jgi:hypothetical protein
MGAVFCFSRTLRQLACGWRVSGGMQLRETTRRRGGGDSK